LNETGGWETHLQDAVSGLFDPGVTVRVSLTAEGERLAQRLGAPWFVRTLAALALAYPDRHLDCLLTVASYVPMSAPIAILPSLAGPVYSQQRGLGRISVTLPEASRVKPVRRTLPVPSDAVLDDTGEFHFRSPERLRYRIVDRIFREWFRRQPLCFDTIRQRWHAARPAIGHMVPLAPSLRSAGPADVVRAPGQPIAWFALHWLEPGGAESWALEAAELAEAAGYHVILTIDVPAAQRLLDRALQITADVFLAANALTESDWEPFLNRLVERFAPRILFIHHSGVAYTFLPELRHRLDDVQVFDSTHIVEHRTGGFVRQSIEFSPLIDLHHVISPQLRDIYRLDAEIPADKVAYHPLTHAPVAPVDRLPEDSGPLRVGFLGRLAPQKRPFLFVELARRLHRRYPGRFEFVVQGDGPMGVGLEAQIASAGLADVVVRRPWGPVEEFFGSIDVLLISSDNEGLTLTTLEAERYGVLVVSTDVGSQRSVTAPSLLLPVAPRPFLRRAAQALVGLARSEEARGRARRDQTALIEALSQVESASHFFARFLPTV
jgi:glycosyltransferase involved in cell wall biosynthesis